MNILHDLSTVEWQLLEQAMLDAGKKLKKLNPMFTLGVLSEEEERIVVQQYLQQELNRSLHGGRAVLIADATFGLIRESDMSDAPSGEGTVLKTAIERAWRKLRRTLELDTLSVEQKRSVLRQGIRDELIRLTRVRRVQVSHRKGAHEEVRLRVAGSDTVLASEVRGIAIGLEGFCAVAGATNDSLMEHGQLAFFFRDSTKAAGFRERVGKMPGVSLVPEP